MQTVQFTQVINAPKEHVWKTMLEKPTYEARTTAFAEWSTYEWSRDQWEKITFIGPDGIAGGGMVAEIAESRLYEYVSIRHLAELSPDEKTGKVIETRFPEPSYENYTLEEHDGVTTVTVVMTALPEEYVEMFSEMWPNALLALKELCE